jgi:CDP-diacylglycerol--serine O-phosphatidyltransferase
MPRKAARSVTNPKKTPLRDKLPDLSLARMLPNMATVSALCMGLTGIRFALLGRYEHAVIAVLLAAILDGIDGRLARLLKATSEFGAELDSLSDFISFGIAPAVMMYIVTLNHLGGFGWAVVLFFAVCMALRLARFNVMTLHRPLSSKASSSTYFVGVPAPAGASIGLLPLILYLATDHAFFITPLFAGFCMLSSGILMVSRCPTYSFKSVQISRKMVLPLLICAALLVASLVNEPWIVLSTIILSYLGLLPFSYRSHRRLHQQGKI